MTKKEAATEEVCSSRPRLTFLSLNEPREAALPSIQDIRLCPRPAGRRNTRRRCPMTMNAVRSFATDSIRESNEAAAGSTSACLGTRRLDRSSPGSGTSFEGNRCSQDTFVDALIRAGLASPASSSVVRKARSREIVIPPRKELDGIPLAR